MYAPLAALFSTAGASSDGKLRFGVLPRHEANGRARAFIDDVASGARCVRAPRLQPAIKRKDWPLARLCWTAQPGLLMQSWRFGRSSMPTSSSHHPPMHKVCNKAYWIPSALGEKTAHGTAWCSNMHGERGLCLINRPGQSLKVAIDRAASHWHEIRDIGLWIRFKHIS